MIEHGPGPDRGRLSAALTQQAWAWVILTSPEAAAVFLEARSCAAAALSAALTHAATLAQGWREAGRPPLRIATVGGGTSAVLSAAPERPPVAFTPSKANAETLSGALACCIASPSSLLRAHMFVPRLLSSRAALR